MADWNGPPAPDDSGAIVVDGFNTFLSNHPDLARSPIRAATEFVRLKDPNALTTRVIAKPHDWRTRMRYACSSMRRPMIRCGRCAMYSSSAGRTGDGGSNQLAGFNDVSRAEVISDSPQSRAR
jgi:hypothetical protein